MSPPRPGVEGECGPCPDFASECSVFSIANRTGQLQQHEKAKALKPDPNHDPYMFQSLFVLEDDIIVGRLISLPYSSKDMD